MNDLPTAPATALQDRCRLERELGRGGIYLITGDTELALDEIEWLVRSNSYYTAGWFQVDPNFASLKGNPRLDKLVTGG